MIILVARRLYSEQDLRKRKLEGVRTHSYREIYAYLYSSLSPNPSVMSENSSMTVRAAWSMSCKARSSLGFAKPWMSENLYARH